ncbi:hypothetical protein P7C70_g8630, partial [Phenoliferia sp. Uapishka_3]
MGPFGAAAKTTAFHESGHTDNHTTRRNWDKLLEAEKTKVKKLKEAKAHLQLQQAAQKILKHTGSVAEQWKQQHKREEHRREFGKAIKSERRFHEVYKHIINGKLPDRLSDTEAQAQHSGHSQHYEGMGIILDPPFHNTTARDAAIQEELDSPKVTFNSPEHPLHRQILRGEVEKALSKTSGRRTASGPDKVSWQQIETMDIDLLTTLFQWCLDHNEVPNAWLIAHIIPIAKKTTVTTDPSTYRGITLESCLLKLLTTILSERLNEWNQNEEGSPILPPNQGGFRPGYRTEANILTLDHILEQARRAGKDVYVAFVDLKKAFETVSRGLLWAKLRRLGYSGKVFDLLRTLYSGLHTMVKLEWLAQGDPLSGILWDIYLHDFRLQEFRDTAKIGALKISHLLFADDIALISMGGQAAMQARINELTVYCNKNCLTISAPKTVVVRFPFSSNKDATEPEYFLTNGQTITEIDHVTYIGILFERNKPDHFEAHTTNLLNKARFVAFGALALQRSMGVIDVIDALKFCTERIHSRLLFGSEVTFNAPAKAHEDLVLTYLQRTLALSDQCTVNGVYTSTGVYSLAMLKLERAVKFLAAMLTMENIHVPLSGKGSRSTTWLSSLHASFSKRGLTIPDPPPGGYPDKASAKQASDKFCGSLREQEKAALFVKLRMNKNGQLLCSSGSWFGLQTYLTTNTPKDRMIMSRLCFKMDELGEQMGRRKKPKIPRENRVCGVCDSGEIEGALHMLMECDGNDSIVALRGTLYSSISALPATASTRLTVLAAKAYHDCPDQAHMELFWHTLLNTRNKDTSRLVTKFASRALTTFMTYERRYKDSLPMQDADKIDAAPTHLSFAHTLQYDGVGNEIETDDDETCWNKRKPRKPTCHQN